MEKFPGNKRNKPLKNKINYSKTRVKTLAGVVKHEKNPLKESEFSDNLQILISDAIKKWRNEFKNNEIKTDSIGDLEKLIKLNILLQDKNEKLKKFLSNFMSKIFEVIKNIIDDPVLKKTILEELKKLNLE